VWGYKLILSKGEVTSVIYLTHGYIDIFNHELRHDKKKTLRLVTQSDDIIFQNNGENKYNSKDFVNKVLEKVLIDLNNQSSVYNNIELTKSALKLASEDQPHNKAAYSDHKLILKLHPSEDTAHVFIDNLNIIAAFRNEISCTRQDYIIKKKVILEENYSKLITIPQHGIHISLNHCTSYNTFKKILVNSIYEDISLLMIDELKKLSLPKWHINLKETNLDIKNIVNDNMKILIA
jgi:hypothetical protein